MLIIIGDKKMLSKKDYERIAGLLSAYDVLVDKELFVESLVDWFSLDNPRFDAERFRQDCMYVVGRDAV